MQEWPNLIASAAALVVHTLAIFSILSAERRQPTATMAWLLAVIALPFVGVVFYLLIGATSSERRSQAARSYTRRIRETLEAFGLGERLKQLEADHTDLRTRAMLRLGQGLTEVPATRGNEVELLINGAATYRAMIGAIGAARHHIHVEFYIIRDDETGSSMLHRLAEKAQQGVEVRVLYDALGSSALADEFWRPLLAAGGEVAGFGSVSRLARLRRRPDRVDFRNHRKIVVVDGRVGFTGGINVGREYLGLDPEMGHWRDSHLRIEGPAVLALQEIFARDWLHTTDQPADEQRWFPEPRQPAADGCLVQVVDSGPDTWWSPIAQIQIQALASAHRHAWLTTPYFIPGPALENALVTLALRGVDVRLLAPARADHFIVHLASRSYYPPLLEAGVRIFEYEHGFIHAKTMLVDSWVATVGSANMDTRSFLLNYELNAFVYDKTFVDQMARQFLFDLEKASEVTAETLRPKDPLKLLLRQSARLLSPLL